MKRLTLIGSLFFAIALCGIGIEHFIYKDFMIGRAPAWPGGVSGKIGWAYLTGAIFIIIGILVIARRKARLPLVLGGVLIFLWAFIRQIPVLVSSSLLSGDWTSAGKALTFFGGCLVMASTFPRIPGDHRSTLITIVNREDELILTGRIALGVFMIISGIQHFMYIPFVASLIPGWFPGNAIFYTKLAGILLIAGGLGLFISPTAKWAAFLTGVMIFLWFWIVHLPRVSVSVSDNIAVFEALGVSGIAFAIAGSLSERNNQSEN
ncbi:MAG TPA: hypothetical protein VFW11_01525 [Cyclobacteriaceae bacterium]|nr:hypothetical protein [Cyclobacteriaceae bacterium]